MDRLHAYHMSERQDDNHATKGLKYHTIYWTGSHEVRKDAGGHSHAAPLGKLHRGGVAIFESFGWRPAPRDTPAIPLFAFTTRPGGDFPPDHGGEWPKIRQVSRPPLPHLP
jgi:hypothetical protein